MMIHRQWLEEINDKLSRDNVPIHQRAMQAVLHWQRATGERKDLLEGYPEGYAFFNDMGSPQEPLAEPNRTRLKGMSWQAGASKSIADRHAKSSATSPVTSACLDASVLRFGVVKTWATTKHSVRWGPHEINVDMPADPAAARPRLQGTKAWLQYEIDSLPHMAAFICAGRLKAYISTE